jgi:hypothetical protein
LERPTLASEATRGSALMRCARQLVAAGCEDQSWQACGHDGQRRLFGGSLHRLAKLTVTEDQKGGLRFAAYVPFPGVRSDATAVSGAAEG